MKKNFSGQAKDEKILLYKKEYPLSFIMYYRVDIIMLLVSSIVIFLLFFLIEIFLWLWIILWILILIIWFSVLYIMWHNTVLIVTNKRVLKFVREWVFKSHMKELKIYNLQENICKTWWFIGKLLSYGNVSFVWKDEKTVIWFRGVKYHEEISMYVSRLRDYILENPEYQLDEIVEFKSRKERYK